MYQQPTTPHKIAGLKRNSKKRIAEALIGFISRMKRKKGRYLVNRKKANTQ